MLLYKTGKLTTFLSTITLHFSVSSPEATWEYPSHLAPVLPFLQDTTWQFMRYCLKSTSFIQLFSFFKQLSHMSLVNTYDTHTVSNVSSQLDRKQFLKNIWPSVSFFLAHYFARANACYLLIV